MDAHDKDDVAPQGGSCLLMLRRTFTILGHINKNRSLWVSEDLTEEGPCKAL